MMKEPNEINHIMHLKAVLKFLCIVFGNRSRNIFVFWKWL